MALALTHLRIPFMPFSLFNRQLKQIVLLTGALSQAVWGHLNVDGLRNLKSGEPIPAVSIAQFDQGTVSTASWRGRVTVVVCLASQQRPSERASMDSVEVGRALKDKGVNVVHLTTEASAREYFRTFRAERKIEVPLLIDESRAFADAIGIIVLPTTLVLRADGTLAHVISLHSDDYRDTLTAYARHALGELTDAQLGEQLKPRAVTEGSASSRAAAHRTLARSFLEKGNLEGAKVELIRSIEQDPGSIAARVDLADVHLRSGSLIECDAALTEVFKQAADEPRAKLIRMFLLVREEQYNEAEPLLIAALVTTPQPERIHAYLGLLYERTGRPEKALDHYKAALSRSMRERF